ncbi:potassium channel family protein [Candidatus Poriferisodalis sp.]|uniref:potassium channel family protein n=1 Tax=Candidatus Poriferisodalis sp. TaxID=3101277 RepID=UPI003B599149
MKGVLRRRWPRRISRRGSESRRRLVSGGLEPVERLVTGLAVLTAILAAGTTGYVLLGLDVLDALYQTVITVSTVGYGDPENVGGRYQLFTIVLILLGTGTSLYTIGVVIEMLFEGRLDDHVRRRRMQRSIDNLSGHSVICGYGQVGRAIATAMGDHGTEVVVIDRDPDIHSDDQLLVLGDATNDRTLRDAGVERAKSMVLALDSDVDNLYVALSARSLCPGLFIVARANSAGAVPKLHQAGANRVINPHQIGGSRMAAIALRPGVAGYFEEVLRRTDQDVRLLGHRIPEGSRFVGRPLSELQLAQQTGCGMLAIHRGGRWLNNPQGGHPLAVNDELIVLGTDEQLSLALALFESGSPPVA